MEARRISARPLRNPIMGQILLLVIFGICGSPDSVMAQSEGACEPECVSSSSGALSIQTDAAYWTPVLTDGPCYIRTTYEKSQICTTAGGGCAIRLISIEMLSDCLGAGGMTPQSVLQGAIAHLITTIPDCQPMAFGCNNIVRVFMGNCQKVRTLLDGTKIIESCWSEDVLCCEATYEFCWDGSRITGATLLNVSSPTTGCGETPIVPWELNPSGCYNTCEFFPEEVQG